MNKNSHQVTLIRPPICIPKSTISLRDGLPSLSLAALSAALKAKGITVKVIDAFIEGHDQVIGDPEGLMNIFGLSIEEIIKRIPPKAKIIGVSLMYTHESFYYRELLKEIINKRKKSKVIIGGEHATFFCESILKENPKIHACVLGEGDLTIVELARKILQEETNFKEVKGIAYLKNGNVLKTAKRERIKDLSTLPRLDWDACKIEKFFEQKISLALLGKKVMPILASRGCPYKCTFCSNKNFWGASWYIRPVADVVEEIEESIEKYNIDAIDFYDASLVIGKKWILDFAHELIRRNLHIQWEMPIGTRAEALTEKILLSLKKSGLSRVNYAPESGSKKILSYFKKECSPEKTLISMKNAVKAGLFVRAHMIMGSPEQSVKDIIDDLKFITKSAWIGIHDVSIFPFVVFPGTEIYYQLKRQGLLENNAYKNSIKINSTSNPSSSFNWNKNFSKKTIYRVSMLSMLYFYLLQYLLRPWRLSWPIINYFKKRSITSIDRFIYYLLNRKTKIFK